MTQVLRVDVRQRGAALDRHVKGDTRPKTARPRDGSPPIVFLNDELGQVTREQSDEIARDAMAHVAKCRRAGKRTRGRKAEPVVSFLVAGMPKFGDSEGRERLVSHVYGAKEVRYIDVDEGSRVLADAYHQSALNWILKNMGPGSRLVRAAVHMDEAAPHMHVLIAAADEQGRLGWNRIRSRFASSPVGRHENARGLREMQTRFNAEVAAKYGMARGDSGGEAPRRREEIDREKGLELRLDEERQRADGLQRDVERLQREVDGLRAERTRDRGARRGRKQIGAVEAPQPARGSGPSR